MWIAVVIGLEGETFAVEGVPGVRWRALPVASKPAPYSPNRESPVPGDNIALELIDDVTGQICAFTRRASAPSTTHLARDAIRALRAGGRHVLDERRDGAPRHLAQVRAGHRASAAERAGRHARVARPAGAADTRKVLIHINNTNPILDEDSPERAELTRRGVEVAFDGMEIEL